MALQLAADFVAPLRTIADALGVSRTTLVRRRRDPEFNVTPRPPRRSHRRLSDEDRAAVLAVLHSDDFLDLAPPQVYARLLDQGMYLCSISTMYRLLRANQEVRERRDLARHPNYSKPELLATAPRQVFTWDIAELRGPVKGSMFHLFVMIDIFSRYVVGWMVANRENAKLAAVFIAETMRKEGIAPGQVLLHADRGKPMTAKPIVRLLDTLGVVESHSRPHVSDDNPFSEAHFKTFKYHPTFPDRFGSQEDAEAFCDTFFTAYNNEHRHSGIALLTPAMVHHGEAGNVLAARATVLATAYDLHPERFVRGKPTPEDLPPSVWINPPDAHHAA